jgi:Xaa-Pro aminopeptidase
VSNNDVLPDNELVLIDAGGELDHYASDLTRTFPINGKYSPEQRAIYEAVLKTQLAVIDIIRPGVQRDELDDLATRTIITELVALGLLSGEIDQLVQEKAHTEFYMHRIGHWIGLDVHDVGAYKVNGSWRALVPGIVLTVEPGIYISPDNNKVDKKWRGIGVRIEDDIVVTQDGCDVLSKNLPKTCEEIEALMA